MGLRGVGPQKQEIEEWLRYEIDFRGPKSSRKFERNIGSAGKPHLKTWAEGGASLRKSELADSIRRYDRNGILSSEIWTKPRSSTHNLFHRSASLQSG